MQPFLVIISVQSAVTVCEHILNKQNWSGNRFFHNCTHMELPKKNQQDKEWSHPNFDSFKVIETVILDKTLINDS